MYFELLTSSCAKSQAVVCAGGRKGWGCSGVDQLYSLVWQGSPDISVAPERDCLHRGLSNRRFRAAEADNCPQNRCLLDCTLLQQRAGECGKASLQSVKERTLCFIHLLSLRPALLGLAESLSAEQGQEAQPGAEGGPACARAMVALCPWPYWLRVTHCLSCSTGCKSFPVSERDICLVCSVPCWVAFPWKVAAGARVHQVVVGCVPLSLFDLQGPGRL